MKIIIFILAFLFFSLTAFAQLEANNWYWGIGRGVQFLPKLRQLDSAYLNGEEAVTFSDRNTGKLLFLSTGNTANLGLIGTKIAHHVDLFNENHEKFTPQPLRGDGSCSQGLLVVPYPNSCNRYYIFSLDSRYRAMMYNDDNYKTQLSYSIVELSDGVWQVIQKDIPVLQDYFTEGMTGTIHGNGHDFWVVLCRYNPASFVSIPVTDEPINGGNAVYSFPTNLPIYTIGDKHFNILKLSPNGKLFLDGARRDDVCMSDFDNTTGVISERKPLNISGVSYTFSPDNSKIYINGYARPTLFQIDISDTMMIPTPIGILQDIWYIDAVSMQLAPDGKIYFPIIPYWTQQSGPPTISYLSCIEEPNKKGDSCKFVIKKLLMRKSGGGTDIQLPNYMDYIFNSTGVLGGEFSPCALPRAVAMPDSGCVGNTLIFTDNSTNAKKRFWQFTGGTPATSSDSLVSVTYTKAGTYTVTLIATNDNGSDTTFTQAIIFPFPTANAGIDKTVCPNSSTQLGAPPEAGNTYLWSDNVPVNERSFSNPTVSPTAATTEYILKVVSGAGCVAWDTVLVTVGTITAKVSPDTALCFGSSVELMASGGSEYSWSPSIGLNDTTLSNPIATPTLTTVYKVLVSSGTCKDSAFVTVTVNPLPTANAGADQTICAGEPVQIGENPIAGNTYFWTPQNGLNNPSLSNPIASPNSTTEYILKVVSGAGCVAWDTVLVTVGNLKAKISGDVEICEGEKTQLLASGGNKYSWSPSVGLNDTTIPNPIASPTVTTIYKVLVSNGNCLDSAFVKITINPKPIADAGADQTPCKGEIIELGEVPRPR